jgi:hypothetical protein
MLQKTFLLSIEQISKEISFFTVGFARLIVKDRVEDASRITGCAHRREPCRAAPQPAASERHERAHRLRAVELHHRSAGGAHTAPARPRNCWPMPRDKIIGFGDDAAQIVASATASH